jgi:hypothetical protein
MKRIAICSVDNRARETADWITKKISTFTDDYMIMDYRTEDSAKPLTHILNGLEIETTNPHDVCIHIGTRYDIDLCCIDKQQNLLRIIHMVEKLSKQADKDLGYDMVFIVHSDKAQDLARCYINIYNLNTKILPNRPASILGKMIVKHMKLIPPKEKK